MRSLPYAGPAQVDNKYIRTVARQRGRLLRRTCALLDEHPIRRHPRICNDASNHVFTCARHFSFEPTLLTRPVHAEDGCLPTKCAKLSPTTSQVVHRHRMTPVSDNRGSGISKHSVYDLCFPLTLKGCKDIGRLAIVPCTDCTVGITPCKEAHVRRTLRVASLCLCFANLPVRGVTIAPLDTRRPRKTALACIVQLNLSIHVPDLEDDKVGCLRMNVNLEYGARNFGRNRNTTFRQFHRKNVRPRAREDRLVG